jgi:hypothetical protein
VDIHLRLNDRHKAKGDDLLCDGKLLVDDLP